MPTTFERPVQLELRAANEDDLPFLFRLYSDVRAPEVNVWGWPAEQREKFLHMQFEAQRHSYQAAYPRSTHHIISSANVPIGRRLVAIAPEGMRLVDISLLDAWRNRGIGARLIQPLIDECSAKGSKLSLKVLRGNPAIRLCQRLGFREVSTDKMYISMEMEPVDGI